MLSHRNLILALAVFLAVAPLRGQTLMQEPLGDTHEAGMSLFVLTLQAGQTIPSHQHAGAVFAYILEGAIENQVEPDAPRVYHAGDFFHERPMQVHRIFRNVSATEPAKLLIFQNTGTQNTSTPGLKPLAREQLTELTNQNVMVVKITSAPGAAPAGAHQHPGPVLAYVLKGEIESQVDPEPAKVYRAGDVFHEPALHAHRLYRNLSKTEPAELLVFAVAEKGRPLAMSVEK